MINVSAIIRGNSELIVANNKAIEMLKEQKELENLLDETVDKIQLHSPEKTSSMAKNFKWFKKGKGYVIQTSGKDKNGISNQLKAAIFEYGLNPNIRVGDINSPRVYVSGSGKLAWMPFIRSTVFRMMKMHPIRLKQALFKIYKR